MRPTVSSGDLALAAQPALPETFAPFGRLLAPGDRSYLGKRGRVLATVDVRRAGPRRVTHLQRYPESKRALLPMGRAPMWLVVLPPGEAPAGPPAVFLVPEGVGVVLREGVWHAGPVPLAELVVCELLETRGPADRLDRRSLLELARVEAVRVLLPEEPDLPPAALDLGGQGTVLLDAGLHGRIRIGALVVEDVRLDTQGPDLDAELASACAGLRALWGHVQDLREVPGVALGRDLYRDLEIDAAQLAPRSETLLAQVLAGHDLPGGDPLDRAMALCRLRHPVPLTVLDAAAVGRRLLIRVGGEDDGHLETGGKPLRLAGRPLVCDGDGRPLASPAGAASSARPGPRARRLLVLAWLPAGTDPGAVEGVLDGVAKTLVTHLGGIVGGRRVAG